MSWSISEAMTDPAIKTPMTFRSEFKFCLKGIPTEITLRLYSPIHSDDIIVRKSHSISVPGLDKQETAACENQNEDGEVLQGVMGEFTCAYNAAVAKGLKPDASWLRADPDFC